MLIMLFCDPCFVGFTSSHLCRFLIHFNLTFRDGVSESQFSQVLNIELDQIIKVMACSFIFIHSSLVD